MWYITCDVRKPAESTIVQALAGRWGCVFALSGVKDPIVYYRKRCRMQRVFDINNRGQAPGGYPVPDDQVRKNQRINFDSLLREVF